MSKEKTPALYVPANQSEENYPKKPKGSCTKSFISCLLAALLTALLIALSIEFLFPISERTDTIDTLHIYDGSPTDVRLKQTKDQAIVEPWQLDFLINPSRLCETLDNTDANQKESQIKLLMLVPSAISHFEQRRTIRGTWGSVAEQPHGAFRLGFVLGTTLNATEEALILEESGRFGDIIQADFEDTFQNLTTKSVLMLKWASKYCSHAQYFLKADDDTFVNLPILTQNLQRPSVDTEKKFIVGSIQRESQPSRIPSEKFYVPESDYGSTEFPPYASGSAYVTRGSTALDLFEASKRVKPFLPIEDVYITGLCADDISATRIHDPSFQHSLTSKPPTLEPYKSLATAHSMTPEEMNTLWTQLMKAVFDSLNVTSSSSSSSASSDWSGTVLVSDIISWPQSKIMSDSWDDSSSRGSKFSDNSFNSFISSRSKSSIGSSLSSLIFSEGDIPPPLALPSLESGSRFQNQASNPSASDQMSNPSVSNLMGNPSQSNHVDPSQSIESQQLGTSVSLKLAGGMDSIPLQSVSSTENGFNLTYILFFK